MSGLRFQVPPPARSAASIASTYAHATGFREYDARWRIDQDINLAGLIRVGHAFGVLLKELDRKHQEVVLAHDYRAYSPACAHAVALGLQQAGMQVVDVGLGVTPMAYFAQHRLGIPALAQVTASHNENGWTGIKMGHGLSQTLGPTEMDRLRYLALEEDLSESPMGGYRVVHGLREAYIEDLLRDGPLRVPRPVVVATGHGTAGWFAPEALSGLGCDVLPLHVDLDWNFPHGTPNPESEHFMGELRDMVRTQDGALGLGFDGDGDRIGVVDEIGRTLYSDKLGLLVARWIASQCEDPLFVVDVKCTSLLRDPAVFPARVHWEKTGHSYIKQAVRQYGAVAGFERSGHFFFRPPWGRGYDDGILSAILLLRMLDALQTRLADLVDALPPTWQSPNYQPSVEDTRKYEVVDQATHRLQVMADHHEPLAGVSIDRVLTINGARVECEDGSWLLIRASSNRPSLVVMAESRTGPGRTDALIEAANRMLQDLGVSALDQ